MKVTPDHGGQTSGDKPIPKFETGAIAFMPVPSGKLWAYRVSVHFGKHYASRNGRTFPVNPAELLTGFEPDFPGYEAIDWGGFKPRTMTPEECLLEDEANQAEILQREAWDSYFDEAYSVLADEYETKLQRLKSKADTCSDMQALPLFSLAG